MGITHIDEQKCCIECIDRADTLVRIVYTSSKLYEGRQSLEVVELCGKQEQEEDSD